MDFPRPTAISLLFAAVVPFVTMTVALLLTRRGKRGVRIDDHPVCRACRYDLFALPASTPACPECGADLARPRAVAVGRREPRPALVHIGRGLFALSVVALGFWVNANYRFYSQNPNKPAWWLVRDADGPAPAVRNAAVDELLGRFAAKRLTPAQVDRVVARAITLQEDDAIAWHPSWGEFVEAARDRGMLDDVRWKRYLRNAIPFAVADHRKAVWVGEPLPFAIRQGPARVSNRSRITLDYTVHAELDGQPVPTVTGSMRAYLPISPAWPSAAISNPHRQEQVRLRGPEGDKLAVGPHQLGVEFRVSVRDRATLAPESAPLADFTLREKLDWVLVPAGSPTVSVVKDFALEQNARGAIKVDAVSHQPGLRTLSTKLVATGLVVPVAAEVAFRAGDRTWRAGDVVLRPPYTTFTVTARNIESFAATQVDVVLHPTAAAARKTPDINRLWEGEIVIPNNPVKSAR